MWDWQPFCFSGAWYDRRNNLWGCLNPSLLLVTYMPTLFSPLQVGSLLLPNRIIMAPLTRCRASAGRVPNDLMLEYYMQRASAGLILSEAIAISPTAVGYPDTPGLWSTEQVAAWKKITSALHARGGHIIAQLWHVGRVSDPLYLDGKLPVAPSALAPEGHVSLVRPLKSFVTPHALTIDEIKTIIADYRQAALNAKEAGFDGVELHAANGYLVDQFLQDSTNRRTDGYGGSIENRARFLREALDALCSVWEPARVGVHLAPRGDSNSMGDSNPEALFTHVACELGQRKLAFLCVRETVADVVLGPKIKAAFGGIFIANQGYTQASGEAALAAGRADAIAFGQPYIANPDLVERFRQNAPLNTPDPQTFYPMGATDPRRGYVDYPSFEPNKI